MKHIVIHVLPHPNGWVAQSEAAPSFAQLFSSRRDALAWVSGYAEGSPDDVEVDAVGTVRALVDSFKVRIERRRAGIRRFTLQH